MAKSDSLKLARRTAFSLLAMALTLPLLVWGTFRALGTMNDDAIGWTPSDLPARRNLEWFSDHFETPDSILVSWPGATLDDPRLERFARALESRSAPGSGGEMASPFSRVVTGREMLDELTAPPRNLPSRQAIERLQGVFVGPDGHSTCAVIVLSEEAAGDGRGVLRTIRDVAQAECGIAPDQLRMAGHLVETATIDAVSLDTLVWLAVPSAVLVILVAWPCLRSLSLTLVICVTAAFCQCLSLALIHFTGVEVSVVYAGMLPLLAESHPALIRDLGVSFGASLLLIAVVLMLGLRSVRLGLVSMLPNVFPITVVFGTMGWLGRSIDVGSMMTAAVGLGIAVDGTVHFLTWFTRGLAEGRSRQASILIAYRRCAGAMLRTTAICGVGLAVYAASSFAPAARFGWIICVLLLAALVGDLLFLPALLCGPLGKVLFPRRGSGRPSEAEQAPPPEAQKAAARAICDCDPASADFA